MACRQLLLRISIVNGDLRSSSPHRTKLRPSSLTDCLDYSYDGAQYHNWLLNEKLVLARETLGVVDTMIEAEIYSLPDKITSAGEDILDNIRDTNHDYGSIVSLIALGRVIRIAGATQGLTSVTLSTFLGSVLGPSLLSVSFAASRISKLQRPELGCDVNSYVNVLKQYEVRINKNSSEQ